MKNINKEFYSGEKKEEEKSIFQKLRKRALATALSGLVLVGPAVAKSGKATSEQLKKDGIVEKLKESSKKPTTEELVDLRLQEKSVFEEQESEKIVNELNYIVEKIGPWACKQLGCLWLGMYDLKNRPEAKKKLIENLNQKTEAKEDIKEPVIMESLKEIDLDPETVKKILKTLPQSWIEEVALITYLDRQNKAVLDEETNRKAELVVHHQSKGKENLSEIYFFKGAKTKRADILFFRLIYECAHANNWRNRCDLSLGQRISLLYEVIKRTESSDRFKDIYVESIKRKGKKEETAKKSVEYWATLCMWTLADPENNLNLFPESHRKLVFDYIKCTDPEFDANKAAKLRNKILVDYLKEKGLVEEEPLTSPVSLLK